MNHGFATHNETQGLPSSFQDRRPEERLVQGQMQGKRAGGRWDPQRRVWELRSDQVVALGREGRIVAAEESI
jgi:hypothetical protein